MLSEFRRKKITYLFNLYDIDHDGLVGRSDFEFAAAALAQQYAISTDSEIYDAIQQIFADYWAYLQRYMDTNMDKTVTQEEFIGRYEFLLRQQESLETLVFTMTEYIIQLTDSDNDGIINCQEYVAYLCAYNVPREDAKDAFDRIDHDLSGTLTRDELLHSIMTFVASDEPDLPGNWLFGPIDRA